MESNKSEKVRRQTSEIKSYPRFFKHQVEYKIRYQQSQTNESVDLKLNKITTGWNLRIVER